MHSADRLVIFQSSVEGLGAPRDFSLQIAWVSLHSILRGFDSYTAETMAACSVSAWPWKTQNISFGLFYVSVKTVRKANYIQGWCWSASC